MRNIRLHQVSSGHHPSPGPCIMSALKHYLTFKLCSAENQVEVEQQSLSTGLTGELVKKNHIVKPLHVFATKMLIANC